MLDKSTNLAELLSQAETNVAAPLQQQLRVCRKLFDTEKITNLGELYETLSNNGSSNRARAAACWLVGWLGLTEARGSLFSRLENDADSDVVWEAARALSNLPGTARRIEALLQTSNEPERMTAMVWALGNIGERRSVSPLIRILQDTSANPRLRGHAAEALGSCGDRAASQVLIEGLADAAPEVRFWSAFALGELGEERALPDLESLAESDHVRVPGWHSVAVEARDAVSKIIQSTRGRT